MNGLTYTQGWNDDRKLLLKMAEIMGEVGAIPKTGFNSFHRYNYHSEADINKAFQVLFSQHKMVLMPSLESSEMRTTTTKNDKTEYIQKARMLFTIYDAETGESLSGHMEGEGQDVGDKALYKGISGTQKYFLMKVFMIQDQNDPEADEGVDERNADKPTTPPKTQGTPTPTNVHSPSTGTSTSNSSGSVAELANTGQAKLIGFKAKEAQVSMERISDLVKYTVTKTDDIHKSDVNKVLKMIEDAKAKLDGDLPY